MFKLIPTDEKFFEMFQKQADYFCKGAAVVREVAAGDLTVKAGAAKLSELESDADGVTHEILVRLDRSFITPIDREDIHAMAHCLDECMDLIEAAVDHLELYGITAIPPSVKSMAEYLEAQSVQISELVAKIPRMQWDAIRPHCIEINRLENEADKVTRQALAGLFQGGLDALEVIKWRDVYKLFEKATDMCEDVAGIVEGIALKNG